MENQRNSSYLRFVHYIPLKQKLLLEMPDLDSEENIPGTARTLTHNLRGLI